MLISVSGFVVLSSSEPHTCEIRCRGTLRWVLYMPSSHMCMSGRAWSKQATKPIYQRWPWCTVALHDAVGGNLLRRIARQGRRIYNNHRHEGVKAAQSTASCREGSVCWKQSACTFATDFIALQKSFLDRMCRVLSPLDGAFTVCGTTR